MLLDRENKKVVTRRIACGIPGRPPKSLDYFEITLTEQSGRDAPFEVDKAAMDALVGYGEQYKTRRRIPIRVDSDDIEDFLVQAYTSRAPLPQLRRDGTPLLDGDGKGVLRPKIWCSGDGRLAKRLTRDGGLDQIRCNCSPRLTARTPDELTQLLTKRMKHNPDDGKRCPFAQNGNEKIGPTCKPETVLICRADVVSNVGSFCRFRSHGHMTADALRSSFEDIKSKMPRGVLRDVPLDLVLQMRRVQVPDSTATTLKPEIHVELRLAYEDTVRLLNANLQQNLQLGSAVDQNRKLLVSARAEVLDDDTGGEWPETKVIAPVIDGAEGGGGL